MVKDSIVVFSPEIARKLLREGHTIIDIKPNKNDPYHARSVFVFKNEDGLFERIQELNSDH